jgi:hypothetical protein
MLQAEGYKLQVMGDLLEACGLKLVAVYMHQFSESIADTRCRRRVDSGLLETKDPLKQKIT